MNMHKVAVFVSRQEFEANYLPVGWAEYRAAAEGGPRNIYLLFFKGFRDAFGREAAPCSKEPKKRKVWRRRWSGAGRRTDGNAENNVLVSDKGPRAVIVILRAGNTNFVVGLRRPWFTAGPVFQTCQDLCIE